MTEEKFEYNYFVDFLFNELGKKGEVSLANRQKQLCDHILLALEDRWGLYDE